jgi:hypothetical protein
MWKTIRSLWALISNVSTGQWLFSLFPSVLVAGLCRVVTDHLALSGLAAVFALLLSAVGLGLWNLGRERVPASGLEAQRDTYNTINTGPGITVGRVDKLTVGQPPVELTADEIDWAVKQVVATYTPETNVIIWGRGKSGDAADKLAALLAAHGFANVKRSKNDAALVNVPQYGRVKFGYTPSLGLPVLVCLNRPSRF